jgi:hypothetical protein
MCYFVLVDCRAILVLVIASLASGQYHGIVINGPKGIQLYDPFNEPHSQGNIKGIDAPCKGLGCMAIIDGQSAYFGSGLKGV